MVAVASGPEARAQDELPGPELNNINNQEQNAYDEKPLLIEQEGKGSRAIPGDSAHGRVIITVPVKSKSPAVPEKKAKDEDPLNFNFLFYIIQKFKSSDLMME